MRRMYRNTLFAAFLLLIASITVALTSNQAGKASKSAGSSQGKYGKYIFSDLKATQMSPEMQAKMKEARAKTQSTVETTHLLNLDTTRAEGAPYLDYVWLWKGSAKGYTEQEHTHDFDEFIGFIGAHGRQNERDLGGEMEVWLGGEKYLITKDCLIYVPAGLKHCPIRFNRIDTPILFFTGGMATKYSRTPTKFDEGKSAERSYAKYISYDVNPEKTSPQTMKRWAELRKKTNSNVESTRLLDLDKVEGAPYIDFVWLWKGSEKSPNHSEHSHDWGEVFGFIGTKGQSDPYNLGGEMELWLGGEKHLLTKSSLVYVPGNLKHCPLQFNRIDSPILLFTVGMTRKYTKTDSANKP